MKHKFVRLGAEFFSFVVVSNVVDGSRGVGLEVLLALGHEALEALNVFPLRLVVQHVRHVLAANIKNNMSVSYYFLRFRFRLVKSYGSGSGPDFSQVTVPVPAPNLKFFRQNLAFLRRKLFYKGKIYKFHRSYC